MGACFDCGSANVVDQEATYQFQYGIEGHPRFAVLTTSHPIATCQDCGASSFDYRGEIARENAINRHLDSFNDRN